MFLLWTSSSYVGIKYFETASSFKLFNVNVLNGRAERKKEKENKKKKEKKNKSKKKQKTKTKTKQNKKVKKTHYKNKKNNR